jgi:hypothetical protein
MTIVRIPTTDALTLIHEAACLAMEQESRGGLLKRKAPRVDVVISKYDGTWLVGPNVTYEGSQEPIELVNWHGQGDTIEEAVLACLWCLGFELTERREKIKAMLARLESAAPAPSPTPPIP